MAPYMSCLLSRLSNCRSQHFCDVCKYMFRMDQSNGHNNRCSNRVFKVYAFCHHCSTVHKVPHRLGSTMLCLSNSSLSNTIHHSLVHHHPTAVNIKSTIFQGDNDIHDNNNSPTSNIVDNDSNYWGIPVTAMSHSPISKIVLVPMEIQRSSSMD